MYTYGLLNEIESRAYYYCTFGFRETIFLGIIEFYPGYGGFVTFESELVPKLVSELVSDNYNMRYRTSV